MKKFIKYFLIIYFLNLSIIQIFGQEKNLNSNINKNFAEKGIVEIEGEIGISFQTISFRNNSNYYFNADFFPSIQYYLIDNLHAGISPGFGYKKYKTINNNIISDRNLSIQPFCNYRIYCPIKN